AELGFGTGLNALAALQAWKAAGQAGPLCFTSFEAFPMAAAEMARALQAFPELADLAAPLLAAWAAGQTRLSTPDIVLEVILGDARETLPRWQGAADCWFLDGFSPARNPELWEVGLLREVGRHTQRGGTCATYSAAGHVREKLAAAGFTMARRAGFGRKRHMTVGVLPE
ncbi:MAG: tRNA (5-methylaminomethyl-2-thiouridine)(34)-methyltransferase MnmD, partial [Pseudomonadota bacterium]